MLKCDVVCRAAIRVIDRDHGVVTLSDRYGVIGARRAVDDQMRKHALAVVAEEGEHGIIGRASWQLGLELERLVLERYTRGLVRAGGRVGLGHRAGGMGGRRLRRIRADDRGGT